MVLNGSICASEKWSVTSLIIPVTLTHKEKYHKFTDKRGLNDAYMIFLIATTQ